VTTVTIAEIFYGINALPVGNRRSTVEEVFNKSMEEAFKYRILSFDESATRIYSNIMSHRKSIGHPFRILDGQIAAIALAHNASLATRNMRDFSDCDLDLINPFQ
jgi:predicted nucleic acid-binding protein